MSNNYLKKRTSLNKIVLIYLLSIIPLVLYGTYKNGILLYMSELISFIEIFKPFLITVIPIVIVVLVNFIKYKKLKITIDDLPWIAVSLFIPINISLLIYIPSILVFIVINQYVLKNINLAIIYKLILVLGLFVFNMYGYSNIAEQSIEYAYNVIDIIFGRSVGGVSSTSLLLAMISYLILYISGYYKKKIIIISMSTYTILVLAFSFIFDVSYTNIAGIFLAIVYFGSFNKFTPITFKSQMIYSLALGITTFLLSYLISYYEGVFIAIIITQLGFVIVKKYIEIKKDNK